jgi:hypothetical protein
MRAYAPSIAQGEGRSLGEWRTGVFSLRPLTIHQGDKNDTITYKVIAHKIHINRFQKRRKKEKTANKNKTQAKKKPNSSGIPKNP